MGLTISQKLVAIHAAKDLANKHSELSQQIRGASESFSCFIAGCSHKTTHPDLNDKAQSSWVEALEEKKSALEIQIMECTFSGLYKDFEEE